MARREGFQIVGLKELQKSLNAIPGQTTRAARNAIGVVLTETQRDIINITNAELGLKKSLVRRRLTVERPKFVGGQVVLSGQISASNRRIALSEYKIRLDRKSPTRAAVYVKDEIGKPERLSHSAFVNPRLSRKKTYRRVVQGGRRVPRGPIVAAAGPSMAIHLRAIVTPQYQSKRSARFTQIFNEKLDEQLKKG